MIPTREQIEADWATPRPETTALIWLRAMRDEIDRLTAANEALNIDHNKATTALFKSGWTIAYEGAEWKPPIGPNPSPLLELIDRLLAALEEARAERYTLKEKLAAMDLLLNNAERVVRDGISERDAAESLAWDALGRPEGTHDTSNVQRLCEAHGTLKAKLAEARAERLGYRTEYLELLRRIREGQLVTATEASLRYEGIIAASSEEPL